MDIFRYTPEYAVMIKIWLKEYNLNQNLVEQLPKVGFMVDNVAAGFLRRVEGGFGMIDSFITNPNAPAHERNKALDIITKKLLEEAKSLELSGVIAFTKEDCIVNRSSKHGFECLHDQVVITKQFR